MSLLTISDLWKRFLDSATAVAQGGDGSGIVTNDGRFVNKYTSLSAVGSATAPLAGASLGSTVSITADGFYRVKVFYGYGGTAEATTQDNFKLTNTGVDISILPATVGNANTIFQMQEFMLNLTAGNFLRLNAIAAASAGAVYKGMIVADRFM